MADDVLLPFERLGAGFAGEEPLVAVDVLLVDLQVAAVGEGLHASLAAVDDVGFHSVVCAGREKNLAHDPTP